MIRSLRYVEPVSSFRSTYAYTNITHLIAGRVVARSEGVADWNVVLREELLDPLGMEQSSYTAEAIKPLPITRKVIAMRQMAASKCLSQSGSLRTLGALAISTPTLMIWRTG